MIKKEQSMGEHSDRNVWEFYLDERGEWRWRCNDVNGETLFISAEGYSHARDARKCAARAGWDADQETYTEGDDFDDGDADEEEVIGEDGSADRDSGEFPTAPV
jgi:uncharacterized protein YegP (UPF0339 family)